MSYGICTLTKILFRYYIFSFSFSIILQFCFVFSFSLLNINGNATRPMKSFTQNCSKITPLPINKLRLRQSCSPMPSLMEILSLICFLAQNPGKYLLYCYNRKSRLCGSQKSESSPQYYLQRRVSHTKHLTVIYKIYLN